MTSNSAMTTAIAILMVLSTPFVLTVAFGVGAKWSFMDHRRPLGYALLAACFLSLGLSALMATMSLMYFE